jgi:response regulator RpfG family c-di-GMP phosphodiesterase
LHGAEDFIDCIFYASSMHDMGKIAVPDKILYTKSIIRIADAHDAARERDLFAGQEWEIMKSHTIIGKRILEKGTAVYTFRSLTRADRSQARRVNAPRARE